MLKLKSKGKSDFCKNFEGFNHPWPPEPSPGVIMFRTKNSTETVQRVQVRKYGALASLAHAL